MRARRYRDRGRPARHLSVALLAGRPRSEYGLRVFALLMCWLVPTAASAAPKEQSCIVIDSDADLDDFRAVATLAPTQRIAAIIVTEGIARAAEGAGAMKAFLARAGKSYPVLRGVEPNPHRDYVDQPDFPRWRANAERLNGLLPQPVAAEEMPSKDLGEALRDLTRDCPRITLLVIGPWTSFLRYAPEMLGHVDRLVAQGRPFPDETGGEPAGQNCIYDKESCVAAFDLLVGRRQRVGGHLKTEWIDIPGSPQTCGTAEPGIDAMGRPVYAFSPVVGWIAELRRAGGMAQVVADMLDRNHDGWARTSLWDDLVALSVLRPDIFVARGGHLEPCVPAATVRHLLATSMAGQTSKH